ncbi:hypothetical protein CHS0354_025465 [Potamilus streckersoni]|uniref:EGF-like domain-containing protein n=1 Tax=Potamilus streckersoni TaxID=2493646 RepID=A0AAE0VIV6_9BIVA|nr:hypothetical protein CHS0354_025465 [Potamilus streckersoni]
MHLSKVSQAILPLLVLGFLTCKCESADVYGTCSGHADCPSNARCRPNSCDGYICLCDEGFVASQDRRRCMKASWIGDPCFNLTSRCVSLFAVCLEGTCRCLDSFVETNDGRCKLPGSSFVGESCAKCEYPTHCVSGVCRCVDNYRPLAVDEYWVNPLSTLQCHPQSYALNKCNGTEIPAPLPLQVLTRSTPIYPEREISGKTQSAVFGSCTSTKECPKFAKCKPGSCDGFLCICDSGFIASEDRFSCLRARRMAEACNSLTDRCMSPFSSCTNSFCECLDIFQPTRDGRCKLPGNNFLGEPCVNSEQCEYPSKCVNGSCVCVEPYREITHEEFWMDPMITSQCRPIGFSVWKCNGTQLDIPKEVSSRQAMTANNRTAIPIDSSVRTTTEGYRSFSQFHPSNYIPKFLSAYDANNLQVISISTPLLLTTKTLEKHVNLNRSVDVSESRNLISLTPSEVNMDVRDWSTAGDQDAQEYTTSRSKLGQNSESPKSTANLTNSSNTTFNGNLTSHSQMNVNNNSFDQTGLIDRLSRSGILRLFDDRIRMKFSIGSFANSNTNSSKTIVSYSSTLPTKSTADSMTTKDDVTLKNRTDLPVDLWNKSINATDKMKTLFMSQTSFRIGTLSQSTHSLIEPVGNDPTYSMDGKGYEKKDNWQSTTYTSTRQDSFFKNTNDQLFLVGHISNTTKFNHVTPITVTNLPLPYKMPTTEIYSSFSEVTKGFTEVSSSIKTEPIEGNTIYSIPAQTRNSVLSTPLLSSQNTATLSSLQKGLDIPERAKIPSNTNEDNDLISVLMSQNTYDEEITTHLPNDFIDTRSVPVEITNAGGNLFLNNLGGFSRMLNGVLVNIPTETTSNMATQVATTKSRIKLNQPTFHENNIIIHMNAESNETGKHVEAREDIYAEPSLTRTSLNNTMFHEIQNATVRKESNSTLPFATNRLIETVTETSKTSKTTTVDTSMAMDTSAATTDQSDVNGTISTETVVANTPQGDSNVILLRPITLRNGLPSRPVTLHTAHVIDAHSSNNSLNVSTLNDATQSDKNNAREMSTVRIGLRYYTSVNVSEYLATNINNSFEPNVTQTELFDVLSNEIAKLGLGFGQSTSTMRKTTFNATSDTSHVHRNTNANKLTEPFKRNDFSVTFGQPYVESSDVHLETTNSSDTYTKAKPDEFKDIALEDVVTSTAITATRGFIGETTFNINNFVEQIPAESLSNSMPLYKDSSSTLSVIETPSTSTLSIAESPSTSTLSISEISSTSTLATVKTPSTLSLEIADTPGTSTLATTETASRSTSPTAVTPNTSTLDIAEIPSALTLSIAEAPRTVTLTLPETPDTSTLATADTASTLSLDNAETPRTSKLTVAENRAKSMLHTTETPRITTLTLADTHSTSNLITTETPSTSMFTTETPSTSMLTTTETPSTSMLTTTETPSISNLATTEAPSTLMLTTTDITSTSMLTTTETPSTSNLTTTETPSRSMLTTTETPSSSDLATTEAPSTSMLTTTETPSTSMLTTTATPSTSTLTTTETPSTLILTTTETNSTSNLATTETPSTSMLTTTETPSTSMLTTAETPNISNLATTEAPNTSMLTTTETPSTSMLTTTETPSTSMLTTTETPSTSNLATTKAPSTSMLTTTETPNTSNLTTTKTPSTSTLTTTETPSTSTFSTAETPSTSMLATAKTTSTSTLTTAGTPNTSTLNTTETPISSRKAYHSTGKQDTKNVTNSKQDTTVVKNVQKEITATERKPDLILQKSNSDNSILIPLNIAGIVAVAVLATLIALALRSRKRQQTKQELNKHSTRSSSVSGDSGGSQVPIRIPRPSVKYEPYYVKNGWRTISTSFSSMPSNVIRHVVPWQEQSDPSSERIFADFEA